MDEDVYAMLTRDGVIERRREIDRARMAKIRARMAEAIRQGKAKWAGDVGLLAGVLRMDETAEQRREKFEHPEFTNVDILEAWGAWLDVPHGNGGGMTIGWGAKGIGFGELTITKTLEGTIKIDSEHIMSRRFVKAVLSALVDKAEVQ